MGKRKRYREYWKERLNYDYNKEYDIYKYLCGGMRHKWQEKKIPKEKRFEAYTAWKEHVIACYETKDLDKLKEFRRYLNRCSRMEKSTKGMPNNIMLPLCISLITTIVTDASWENMFGESLNVIGNFAETYGMSLKVGILSIIGVIIFIVCVILVVLTIFIPIFFLIMKVFITAISEGETESFYEDYIEIMDEVITQKEALSEEKIKANKG